MMILTRIYGHSLEPRVLRYFCRNRKRSIDVYEITRVFTIRPEESLRILRQLQEDMMLRDVGSNAFTLTDKVKAELNVVRIGAIVLIVVAILVIYTIIIRTLGVGRY